MWLGNARGNKHSTKHKILNGNSRKYWSFSWHEIGYYDLPAMLDYVLDFTRWPKTFYVGHSQGTTVLTVLLSTRPEYNQKIIQAHLMSPAVFLKHTRHPLGPVFGEEIRRAIERGFKTLDFRSFWDVGKQISSTFCSLRNQGTLALCRNLIFGIAGMNRHGIEMDTVSRSERSRNCERQ